MHARELIDLAAFIAGQGPVFLSGMRPLPEPALAQYWTTSKCRLDRWNRSLRQAKSISSGHRGEPTPAIRNLQAVCEEILVSEMVTRIWSSLLTALDYQTGGGDAQPVAANVLAGHLDASNRVLSIIPFNPHRANTPENELNRLRRLTERWTDLLLSSLGSQVRIADFAHDATRAEEFSHDFKRSQQPSVRRQAWGLLTNSLRETFDPHLCMPSPNADLNSRIGGAILACFPVEVFDSTGAYHSLWNLRVSTMTSEAQQWVDQLLAADSPTGAHGSRRF